MPTKKPTRDEVTAWAKQVWEIWKKRIPESQREKAKAEYFASVYKNYEMIGKMGDEEWETYVHLSQMQTALTCNAIIAHETKGKEGIAPEMSDGSDIIMPK